MFIIYVYIKRFYSVSYITIMKRYFGLFSQNDVFQLQKSWNIDAALSGRIPSTYMLDFWEPLTGLVKHLSMGDGRPGRTRTRITQNLVFLLVNGHTHSHLPHTHIHTQIRALSCKCGSGQWKPSSFYYLTAVWDKSKFINVNLYDRKTLKFVCVYVCLCVCVCVNYYYVYARVSRDKSDRVCAV